MCKVESLLPFVKGLACSGFPLEKRDWSKIGELDLVLCPCTLPHLESDVNIHPYVRINVHGLSIQQLHAQNIVKYSVLHQWFLELHKGSLISHLFQFTSDVIGVLSNGSFIMQTTLLFLTKLIIHKLWIHTTGILKLINSAWDQ